jgi:hypothetical protein
MMGSISQVCVPISRFRPLRGCFAPVSRDAPNHKSAIVSTKTVITLTLAEILAAVIPVAPR